MKNNYNYRGRCHRTTTYIRCQHPNEIRRDDSCYSGDAVNEGCSRTSVIRSYVQSIDLHAAVVGTHEGHSGDEPKNSKGGVATGVGSKDNADSRTSCGC